ncbi:MAG: threonine ammonia-lyase, biosynthetic [Porticoccaceae bacterium]|nr:threonine ammonia-lyase, biosynthetic [Porticoccaceae bacterium]
MPESYVRRILNANIYDLVEETPVDFAPQLSQRFGNRILIKREDLQPVFSFKLRGAYNRMMKLTAAEKQRGVVAASAGNHAQGMAMAARKMGVRAVIVMPRTTPAIKINAVQALGGEVVLVGDNFDAASAHAMALVEKSNMVYIHPFDDPEVIAGQGTVAMEILRQISEPIDAIFVCVGGGGLCAGIAAYVKYVRPDVKIIAVEPNDAACLKAALVKNRRVRLKQVGLFADGAAVAQIGKETFRVLKETLDAVVTVTTDEICAAIKDIFEDTRSIAEPAGALSVAGMKKYIEENGWRGKTLVAIESGANMNFDRLRYISERTEIGEKREAVLAVTIAEQPGSFKQFCHLVSGRMVTEFNYRYGDPQQAHIFVGVQVASDADRETLVTSLRDQGYAVEDMTDNEMAKLHIRHMVGGRATAVKQERVFRFEFPERPGALANFLNRLAGTWNISMFHYRNHGAAFGRVLVGLEVPTEDRRRVAEFLQELDYDYCEETQNPAYQFFLR